MYKSLSRNFLNQDEKRFATAVLQQYHVEAPGCSGDATNGFLTSSTASEGAPGAAWGPVAQNSFCWGVAILALILISPFKIDSPSLAAGFMWGAEAEGGAAGAPFSLLPATASATGLGLSSSCRSNDCHVLRLFGFRTCGYQTRLKILK